MKTTGKKYIVVCTKHWTTFLTNWLLALIILALVLFLSQLLSGIGGYIIAIRVVAIIVALYFIIKPIILKKSEYVAVDYDKIVGHHGFMKSMTLSIPIDQVTTIGFSNSFLGKVFNYHDILINNAGGMKITFHHMSKGKHFVDTVEAVLFDYDIK